ncbi:hypothetical protein AtDm6_3455 [Acetobacter tropicalis]|uniref:Uncharacterized protein n=1 Tax=Acetobacter tropicalis TaxID=104102 RepID=A0A094YHQ5_9PROT|nr:hypothetical protein AtDm6_3455 [Acetobacter tropicalis]
MITLIRLGNIKERYVHDGPSLRRPLWKAAAITPSNRLYNRYKIRPLIHDALFPAFKQKRGGKSVSARSYQKQAETVL